MKIVSISIDDALLARAERLAGDRGVSVETMVRDLIARETGTETEDAYRARLELVEMARNSRHGMTGPWNREEAYAERLSRYERADLRGDRPADGRTEVGKGDGIVMEADFAISAQVMAEFVSVVGRRSAPPMDEDKIDGWLVRLAYRLPIPIDAELVRRGRAISAEHGINYYDGAILAAAARLGCDTVLSEDMTDGRSYDSVTVRNPFRGS